LKLEPAGLSAPVWSSATNSTFIDANRKEPAPTGVDTDDDVAALGGGLEAGFMARQAIGVPFFEQPHRDGEGIAGDDGPGEAARHGHESVRVGSAQNVQERPSGEAERA
jgi:hypothetical protein